MSAIRIGVLIGAMFLASVASGQRVAIDRLPEQVKTAATNAVVVRAGSSKGSGCYLGDGLFLTAAHVMRGEAPVATVTFPDGRSYQTRLVANDPQYDQALLESSDKPDGGVPLAEANAGRGARLFLGGYSQGPPLFWPSVMRGVCSPVGGPSADWITTSGESIPGDSGGPIFSETGCIIGNLWGGSRGETTGVNCGRTQRFLQRFRDRLKAWHTQGRGCFGSCPQPTPDKGGYYMPPPMDGGSVQVEIEPGTPVTPPAISQRPDYDSIAAEVWNRIKDKPELRGPPGPPGKDGEVTTEQITAIVTAISQQIKSDPAMRGPQGEPGPPGVMAPEEIERIKAEIVASLPKRRFLLIDGESGTVIDDESYGLDEPIVLDVRAILK